MYQDEKILQLNSSERCGFHVFLKDSEEELNPEIAVPASSFAKADKQTKSMHTIFYFLLF